MNTIKTAAIMAIALLISVAILGSGWITMEVEAASSIDDPYDIRAAPHFADVAYSFDEPTYQTAFDSIGSWKVSVGSPIVTVADSAMTLTARTTTAVELTLAEDDRPGINTTVRSYLQTKVRVGNLTSQYTNITMENASSGDRVWISFHDTVCFGYSGASGDVAGTLYASPEIDTWYRVAFELTASAATFYIYSFDGTCLANQYTNSANLTVGQISEIHLSVAGKASGYAVLDYLYVSGSPPTAEISTPSSTKSALTTNSGSIFDSCDIDPTRLSRTRSGSQVSRSAYGLDPDWGEMLSDSYLNTTEILEMFGTTPELSQRYSGKYVAKGWSDFRASIEASLEAKIAETHGITASGVFLIDYYIDYIQFSTEIDYTIVDKLRESFWGSLARGFEKAGWEVDWRQDPVDTSNWYDDLFCVDTTGPTAALSFDLDIYSDYFNCTPAGLIYNGAVGVADWFNGMANTAADALDYSDELEVLMRPYMAAQENMTEAWLQIYNSTTASFARMQDQWDVTMDWVTGRVDQMTKGYDDAIESITKFNAQVYDWTQEQFTATNAMYYDLLNKSSAVQEYFAGQLAKQNEVITNITQDVYGTVSSALGMWNSFLGNGKAEESTPLTLVSFFGSQWFTYIVVIIVCIVIIALVILLLRRPKSSKGGRRKS